MTGYVDSSALLRVVLEEPHALDDLPSYDTLISNELLGVECHRTIDRLRLSGALTLDEAAARAHAVGQWLEGIDLVLLRPVVLNRASEPMPTPLGTLDALHLATALVWRDRRGAGPVMITHDEALGRAARAFGLDVKGVV